MTALEVSSYTSFHSSSGLPELTPALYGLPGRIVELVDPYTEADPAAVLATFLTAFGNAVGSGPHVRVGADVHRSNLFVVLVGRSSKSRKGSSWSPIRALFEAADPTWARDRIVSGLGSGEGLVFAVRDATLRDGEVVDPGEPDKRALILATEFAAILRVISRQGSTLSPVLRDAWDRGDLRVTTKNSPLRATGAHVSVLAHVTEVELRRELTQTEAASGFGNRFLWIAASRSKMLPEPEPFDPAGAVVFELRKALDRARQIGTVDRDEMARAMWSRVYPTLARDRYGLAGALSDRAEAQVVRLALLYALTDETNVVRAVHLEAALHLWVYAEASVEHVFGSSTGDPLADLIEAELDRSDGGLTKTDISNLAGRNYPAARLDVALELLVDAGRARVHVVRHPSGGRPATVYESTKETNKPRDDDDLPF